MTKRNFPVVVVIGAGLLAGLPRAQAGPEEGPPVRQREFQLDSGESRTLTHEAVTAHRVCMAGGRTARPLKVVYDGKVAIVEPGECLVIQAARVRLSTAERLRYGETLFARVIPPDAGRHFETEVGFEQTARNDTTRNDTDQ